MPRASLAAASVLMTGPSVARIDAADDVVEPPSSASRVVCRCLEWPKAVSGFLNRLRLTTVPVGVLLAHRSATNSKQCSTGPGIDVEGGDPSP